MDGYSSRQSGHQFFANQLSAIELPVDTRKFGAEVDSKGHKLRAIVNRFKIDGSSCVKPVFGVKTKNIFVKRYSSPARGLGC